MKRSIFTESLETMEKRLAFLAREKSRLELLNRMLTRLSSVAGLEGVVRQILQILLETIGASEIRVWYRLGDEWYIAGLIEDETAPGTTVDSRILETLQSGAPRRYPADPVVAPLPGGSAPTETWVFPLICRDRKIGAVIMEQMILFQGSIMDDLLPFFTYAALMLDNEINNFSKLEESHRSLRRSESLYRALFEQLPIGVVLYEPSTLLPHEFNTVAHTQLGYTREEFASLSVMEIEAVFDRSKLFFMRDVLMQEKVLTFETLHRTRSGELRNVSVLITLFDAGETPLVLAIHRDVTEMRRASERLQLLDLALNTSQEAMYLINQSGDLRDVNDESARQLGIPREQLLTMRVFDVDPDFPPERWPRHWEEMRQSRSMTFESRHRRGDGSIFPVEICGTFVTYEGNEFILALVRDITDRKRAEEERLHLERQLLHAQKLESLGVLAGGIAHDFNNILTAILGNTDLALMKTEQGKPVTDHLRRIEKSAIRAADLARQMLAYSGKGKFVLERISLNTLIEEMIHLLEVSISRTATFRYEPMVPLPLIEADPTQIRQVIMNLVINASEALGEEPGTIVITTGHGALDADELRTFQPEGGTAPGRYVWFDVSDTGCGMSRDTLDRLFEPFFTTKFTGRGLGMSAVLGIVRSHGGGIRVESEEGRGTTFRVIFPSVEGEEETVQSGADDDTLPAGRGVVLLVDDEKGVRNTGSDMLTSLGFQVITASNGEEALELHRSRRDISLTILDLTMPVMDGRRCFQLLREMDPGARVILMSGFSTDLVSQRFTGERPDGFLGKPFTVSSLKKAIQSLTDRSNR